jgi:hypothetical protein
MKSTKFRALRCVLFVAGAVVAAGVGSAHAAGYDFRILMGAQKVPAIQQAGRYICVDVSGGKTDSGNTAIFTIWSRIPQPASRIGAIVFDMGRHSALFSKLSVQSQFPGLQMHVTGGHSHAYLPGWQPDHAVKAKDGGLYNPYAIAPGQYVILEATLAPGTSLDHVISALNEGMNGKTEATGVRLGVLVYHLLGKRPDPTKTIMDDAGFAMRGPAESCRMKK